MSKLSSEQHATLPNIAGTNLPPVVLTISADFQYCVDAGARSADYFFKKLTTCGLHEHMAASSRVFIRNIKGLLYIKGDSRPFNQQNFIDAFVAGYLGRIQQELRLFYGEKALRQSPQYVSEAREGSTCLYQ